MTSAETAGSDRGPKKRPEAGPAEVVLTWAAIIAAVALPFLGMAVWLRTPWMAAIVAGLQAVELDKLRAEIVGALLGALLVTLVTSIITGRSYVTWGAGGLAFAALFVLRVPGNLGPQPLPHQAIDHMRYAAALLSLTAMGVAASGVGSGLGRAIRAGAKALWDSRHDLSPRRFLLLVPFLLLSLISVYGLAITPSILLNGPWVGVVKGTAVVPTPHPGSSAVPLSPARQVTISYQSAAFNTTRQAIVMLPAGYDSSKTKRYGVVYLLHGAPGAMGDWPNELGAGQIEASAEQSGAPPLILVAPDGNGPRGSSNDSWADGYVPGDNMESDLIGSLIPAIDQQFRTLTGAAHRGVGGLSTGGYGAANLALRHPNLFSLSLVLSVDPLVPPANSFGGNSVQQAANNPLLLAKTPATPTSPVFFVGWGTSDAAAAPNSAELVSTLQASGYTVSTDPVPGGHEPSVWQQTLYTGLVRYGSRLA